MVLSKRQKRTKQQAKKKDIIDPIVQPQVLAAWPEGYRPPWLGRHIFLVLTMGTLIAIAGIVIAKLA